MVVFVFDVYVELRPGDGATLLTRSVQVVVIQPELFQLVLQGLQVDTQVEHRAQEHVAADAAEQVEVKGFHGRMTVKDADYGTRDLRFTEPFLCVLCALSRPSDAA